MGSTQHQAPLLGISSTPPLRRVASRHNSSLRDREQDMPITSQSPRSVSIRMKQLGHRNKHYEDSASTMSFDSGTLNYFISFSSFRGNPVTDFCRRGCDGVLRFWTMTKGSHPDRLSSYLLISPSPAGELPRRHGPRLLQHRVAMTRGPAECLVSVLKGDDSLWRLFETWFGDVFSQKLGD